MGIFEVEKSKQSQAMSMKTCLLDGWIAIIIFVSLLCVVAAEVVESQSRDLFQVLGRQMNIWLL